MSVSSEDIVWAYRYFLERDPENDDVIKRGCKNHKDMRSVVEQFMGSDEYAYKEIYKKLYSHNLYMIDVDGKPYFLEAVSSSDSYAANVLGKIELNFQNICRSLFAPNDICLDVGANIGVTALIASRFLPTGMVHAFEGGPGICDILARNIQRNLVGNIKAYNYAVTSASGSVEFLQNSAYGHITKTMEAGQSSVAKIPAISLDDFVEEYKIGRIRLVKIDVEGFENEVLKGALATIERDFPFIYFELNPLCMMANSDTNPFMYLKRLLNIYPYLYDVRKSGFKTILSRVEPESLRHSLAENMYKFGGVTDMLASPVELPEEIPGNASLSSLHRDSHPFLAKPVTNDDVINAYKFVLGRFPENSSVVASKAKAYKSFAHLRDSFLNCEEFRSLLPTRPHFAFDATYVPERIDTEMNLEQAHLMAARVEKTWSDLGKTDPFFSVITSEKYHSTTLGKDTLDEFYATGSNSIAYLDAVLKRSGAAPIDFGNCLEFGCGVGRNLVHLAKRFDYVCGVDISNPHLDLARRILSERGIENVSLMKIKNPDDLKQDTKYSFIFSIISLQHNPPPIMKILLANLFANLAPGGVVFFQIPTSRRGYSFILDDYLSTPPRAGEFEMHVLPQRIVLELANEANLQLLDIHCDSWADANKNIVSESFLFRKLPSRQDG